MSKYREGMVLVCYELKLEKSRLTGAQVDILVDWLLEYQVCVEELHVWKNRIGDDGARALARYFRQTSIDETFNAATF